jgi:hypothetical protein
MRRVARLLSLSVLLLPGCILVAHDHDWDDGHSHPAPKSSLEQRVSELEHRVHEMQECMENCTAGCCKPEAEDKEHAEVHEGKTPAGQH